MKFKLFFITTTFCITTLFAQNDTMYIMREGVAIKEFNVNTEIDSIIFYNPENDIENPPSSNVPFYNLTGKQFGKAATVSGTPVTEFNTGGGSYEYRYTSEAAGGIVGFDVLLPSSYASSPNKKYPVLFFLHGRGALANMWTYNGDFQTNLPLWWGNGSVGEFIFVAVGGPKFCWWSDGNDGVNAESHIVNELLSVVDQNFRTHGTQQGRAIFGFSMGGFGATKIAIKYPQYFAVSGSYCGAIYDGTYGSGQGFGTGFGADYASIWGNTTNYAKDCGRVLLPSKAASIIAAGTKFVLRAGLSDTFLNHNRSFRTELQDNGISPTYYEEAGNHTMDNVTPQFFVSILENMTVAN